MARDYALHAGETGDVGAGALRGRAAPARRRRPAGGLPGALLSLADRLDLVAGLAATVGLPTGSSDPFALRRAALGPARRAPRQPALSPAVAARRPGLAADAASRWRSASAGRRDVAEFLARRLEQQLTEEGQPVDRVRAVLPHADRPVRSSTSCWPSWPRWSAAAAFRGRGRGAPARPGGSCRPAPGRVRRRRCWPSPAERRLHEALAAVRGGPAATPDLVRFTAGGGAARRAGRTRSSTRCS